jgi:hypothetical protein
MIPTIAMVAFEMAAIDQAANPLQAAFTSKFIDSRSKSTAPAKIILAFIGVCAIAKLFAAWMNGFTGDGAYTVVISRSLQLSYFDHPPLHQWIVHGFGALFGEGWWLSISFLAMAEAINLPLYGLTRRLFGPDAALWALFGFNATAYFAVWPDGLILPDVPLFLFLTAGVWAVAEILFGPARKQGVVWALWLSAGAAFGFAGLSKYAAIFVPAGLLGFLIFSPQHRHWFRHPEPYVAAALALLIFSPALIWNYQNNWVSFAFQSGRAASGASLSASAFVSFSAALGAQLALLSPWVGAPLVIALVDAARSPGSNNASRFLLWLVAVPLALFLSMPFMGKAAIPHWYNSAWMFAFPLLGHSLSERSARWLRSWAQASAALTAACLAVFVTYVAVGPFWQTASAKTSKQDPTQWSYSWDGLKESRLWRGLGGKPHAFVVVDNWRVGGKTGAAFGPGVPVCAFSQDPREFAFVCPAQALLGQDALIVLPKERSEDALAAIAPYFQRLDSSEEIAIGRIGRSERVVTLTHAHVLLRPYPLPFGNALWTALSAPPW